MIWKARNSIVFWYNVLSLQRLKSSFVNLLRLETSLFIEDGPKTSVNFFDWVGANRKE